MFVSVGGSVSLGGKNCSFVWGEVFVSVGRSVRLCGEAFICVGRSVRLRGERRFFVWGEVFICVERSVNFTQTICQKGSGFSFYVHVSTFAFNLGSYY